MSKRKFPKIQHYVPQFILKNFCIGNTSQLFVFDKSKGKVFKSHIKNVAAENGFYDIKLDEFTATLELGLSELEGKASPIIKKIIDEESLVNISISEKEILSYFFAVQMRRVKQVRNTYKQINDAMINLVEKMGFNSKDVPDICKEEDDYKMLSILGMGDSIIKFAPYFLNKDWILYKAPVKSSYCISDNPVTLQNSIDYGPMGNLGLAVKGIEIYFPISKFYSLGLICKSFKEIVDDTVMKLGFLEKFGIDPRLNSKHEQVENTINYKKCIETGIAYHSKPENVINKNSLQVIQSTRFLFAETDDFELARKMINDHPELKNSPQIQHNQ